MNQRVLFRFAIGLLIVAVIIFGYQWLNNVGQDPDLLRGDSKGMVAALRLADSGTQAVVFDANNKLIEIPGYSKGVRDADPSWRADGQRLFFASNREDNTFHVFRWRPGAPNADRRTFGKRSRSAPHFGFPDDPKANESGIITSGGVVLEFRPKDGSTRQLMPPPTGAASESEEGGKIDQFTGAYRALGGNSFRKPRWTLSRRWVVAIMQREGDEVVIAQDLEPQTVNGKSAIPPPLPLAAGKKVDFDVASNGLIAITVTDYQWVDSQNIPEEFIKGEVATRPFVSGIFTADLNAIDQPPKFLALTNDATLAFMNPSVAPDGSALLFTPGKLSEAGDFTAEGLFKAPLPLSDQPLASPMVKGDITEVAWRPDGERIAYIKREKGIRGLFTNNRDASDEVRVSSAGESFAKPSFSPQVP